MKKTKSKENRKPAEDITAIILKTILDGGVFHSSRGAINYDNCPRSYSEAVRRGLGFYTSESL